MTDKTQALRDLLVKVEAGEAGWNRLATIAEDALPPREAALAATAYRGSLDAAKALHEAVLPGWVGSFASDGFARVAKGGRVLTLMECARIEGQPARAWLIAILRALIAHATP